MKNVTNAAELSVCNLDWRWTQLCQPLQQDDIQFLVNLITATHHHEIGNLLVLLITRWVRDCRTSRKVMVKVTLVKRCLRISQTEKTSVGKPWKRQLDEDENDLKAMRVKRLKKNI